MKTTFSLSFSWSCRPFCLPTLETHIEMSEDDEQPAPAEQDEQAD